LFGFLCVILIVIRFHLRVNQGPAITRAVMLSDIGRQLLRRRGLIFFISLIENRQFSWRLVFTARISLVFSYVYLYLWGKCLWPWHTNIPPRNPCCWDQFEIWHLISMCECARACAFVWIWNIKTGLSTSCRDDGDVASWDMLKYLRRKITEGFHKLR
jgi:hypothetical protein